MRCRVPLEMGSVSSKKKKITRTTILSPPVLSPSGEVKPPKPAIQSATDVYVTGKGSPLYLKKLNTWAWENAIHHHTKKFDLPRNGTLVVRRGQPFKMTLTFNRPYNSLTDELKFFFETGESPKSGNDTMICLSSYTSQGSSGWKSDFLPITGIRAPDGLQTDLWIYTPADCIVSDWKFSVQSIYKAELDTAMVSYEHPEKIYILFNPWDKKDTVYYPVERMLEEYIMNSSGLIFLGTNKQKIVKQWIFGQGEALKCKGVATFQFEPGILEACFYVLKRAFGSRTNQAMGDPVRVSRTICSFMNGQDNHGVLEGRWSTNDFSDGRPPTVWSGSVSILNKYVTNAQETKGGSPQPVKYGQCYIFAAILTTICRAIGIPCRCVTSYNSGTNINRRLLTDINYLFDEKGEDVLKDTSDEAIWSFHVWNDAWMRRMDLNSPLREGDWHVLDPTSQQYGTDGIRCCGPAHHVAIRMGLTDVMYDVNRIYTQLNASVSYWLKLNDQEWALINAYSPRDTEGVSTKLPDGRPVRLTHKYTATITEVEMSRMRQDVTLEFKRRDGMINENRHRDYRQRRSLHQCSAQMRLTELPAVLGKGCQLGSLSVLQIFPFDVGDKLWVLIESVTRLVWYGRFKMDVTVRFSAKEFIYFGEVFYVTAHLENTSSETRTVKVILFCESIHYNGQRESILKKKIVTKILEPQTEDGVQLKLKESNYVGKLAEHNILRQFVFIKVEETDQIEVMFDDFILQKPHLKLEPDENVTVDTNFELKLKLKNPLQRPLTECSVCVEGTGIESMLYIRNFEEIPAECEWTGIINLMPVRTKSIQLSATFHCKELFDLTGTCLLQVKSMPKLEVENMDSAMKEDDLEIIITGLDLIENSIQ